MPQKTVSIICCAMFLTIGTLFLNSCGSSSNSITIVSNYPQDSLIPLQIGFKKDLKFSPIFRYIDPNSEPTEIEKQLQSADIFLLKPKDNSVEKKLNQWTLPVPLSFPSIDKKYLSKTHAHGKLTRNPLGILINTDSVFEEDITNLDSLKSSQFKNRLCPQKKAIHNLQSELKDSNKSTLEKLHVIWKKNATPGIFPEDKTVFSALLGDHCDIGVSFGNAYGMVKFYEETPSPLKLIFPKGLVVEDHTIIGLSKFTQNKKKAHQTIEWFFSQEAQERITHLLFHYPTHPDAKGPSKLPPLISH